MSPLQVFLILCLVVAGSGSVYGDETPFLHHEPKIVNGLPAEKGEFPYMVYVQLGNHMCGGSIYNRYTILTAAQCIINSDTGKYHPDISEEGIRHVSVGVHNHTRALEVLRRIKYESSEMPENVYRVDELISHPGYKLTVFGLDIAILRLGKSITYHPGLVEPIPMASRQEVLGAKEVTVTGWGKTSHEEWLSEILQKVELDVVASSECGWIPMAIICAGRPGKDACGGDAGAPLVVKVGDCVKQIGMFSYGNGKCAEKAGIYTDVTQYGDWIQKIAGRGDGECN